jgi:hypothetical protein
MKQVFRRRKGGFSMSKLDWVKELVRAEEQMEESGVVDLTGHLESERLLITETLGLLETLKNEFIESATAFNELKASALGRIKIYGIAKTQADFMLFRNGFKMIFSFSEPGKISIRFNFLAPQLSTTSIPSVNSTSQSLMEEHLLIAKKGPFHEINWTFQEHPINIGALVRYHLSLFIKESAK